MKEKLTLFQRQISWLLPKAFLILALLAFIETHAQPCTAAIATNFSENFDSTSTGSSTTPSVPNCWSYIDNMTTTGYGYTANSTTTSRSAPKFFRFYRMCSTTNVNQDLTLVSPETVNLGNGTKQLRFYARGNSATVTSILEVVRLNGNTSAATPTVLATFNITGNTYSEYIVPLPVTTDDYFGFRVPHNGSTSTSYPYAFIDDVFYEDLETCFFPTDVIISAVTQNTATISWTASIDPNVTSYEYEVRSSGLPGSGTTGLEASGSTSGTSDNITGLSPSTTYTVYVRSVCGASVGRWNPSSESFITLCGLVTGNLYENFDTTTAGGSTNPSPPNCWTYLDDMTGTGYGYTYNSATYSRSGNNSFRFYMYNALANDNQYLYLISPETNNLGNGTKQLRFYARMSSATISGRLQVVTLNDISSPSAATTSATVLATIDLTSTSYNEYIVPLPVTTDDYFALRVTYNGNPANNYPITYIDDIYYEDLSPCIFPMNIDASAITGNTATISWDASLATGITGYEYEIRTSGDAGSGTVGLETSDTVTGTSVNITGLDPATQYVVYVRSICGMTNGIWTAFPLTFYTLCGIVTGNFYESFDTTETGTTSNNNFPYCWSYVDEVITSGYGYVNATNAQSPSNSYRLYRTNTTANQGQNLRLISPETDNLGNGNWVKQVRFSARSTSSNPQILEVFTSNGTTSTANFTVLDSIVVSGTTYQEYTIYLPQTTNDYFGFNLPHNGTTSAGTVHIDDVYYEDTPSCKPLLPENITISKVLKNGATISWTDLMNISGVAYEVEVRESGDPGDPGADFIGTTAAGVTTINATGLNPTTRYSVYVRVICSATDESTWAYGGDLQTSCDYPDLIAAPPVVICGYGPVDLTAIFDGGIVQWFDAEEDGNLVHTGPTFTTPSLSANTSYWVTAGDTISAPTFVGPTDPSIGSTSASTTTHYRVFFTVTNNINLQAVDIFPQTAGQSGTIDIYTAAGTKVNSTPFTTTVGGTTSAPVVQTVVLNTQLPAGDYYMIQDSAVALFRNTTGASYPYSTADISITGHNFNGYPQYHYFFYNWQIGGGGCTAPRVEVPVTISPKPAFELSTDKVISCEGDTSTPVTITTNLGGYDTFVWTPSTGVSGDEVNGWTFNTSVEQEYTLVASQSNGICEHIKTVLVTSGIKPEPNPNLATVHDVCKNTVTELNVLEDVPNTITIGNLATTTTSTSEVSAFVQSAEFSKQQYIFSAAELQAQGLTTAGYITELAFETINSGASLTNDNYTIKMMLTANTTFPDNNFVTGNFNTVYSAATHTHTFQGIQNMVLNTPFYWDGQSNIIVQITQEGTGSGNNAETYFTSVSGNNVGLYGSSTTDPDPVSGTRTTDRLDLRFGLEQSTVTWSPASNLYLDAATTIPYTSGSNALTVYTIQSLGGTQVYTALLTAPGGCSTSVDYTINVADVGTPIVQNQTFCDATPVTEIVVTGHQGATLAFYDSATATTAITTISQTGTYYVEAVLGLCKSVRIPFTATITPLGLPTATFTQVICGTGTIADLTATGVSGSQINWYDSAASTTALPSTHVLVDNTTYYAAQQLGNCESGRIAVLVSINTTALPALTSQTITVCGDLTYGSIDLNQISGSELVWYPSATSQTPIPNTNSIVSGTYYVSQKLNSCESARVQITVSSAQSTVPAPSAGVQNICGNGTVAQLTANILPNAIALWYSSAASTTPLQPTDLLVSGTYYVAQQEGNCISPKIPVAVRVTNTSAPAVAPFLLCEGSTVADLNIYEPTGISHKWFINSTSTTELPLTDILVSGYYFVTRVENGCESERTQVQVTINNRPNSPTGASPQTFTDYAEISNIIMDEPNVIWYITYDDALNGVNPLNQDMPLVNGTTYYAVIIGTNGCPSLPTPIETIIVLGVNDFDLSKLKYYPNPVNDLLTITYADVITNVEVFDLNGRMVIKRDFDNQTVQLDFSSLSSGTYMLNIKTKENSQFVKIVKK